jgi:hypothetical protein
MKLSLSESGKAIAVRLIYWFSITYALYLLTTVILFALFDYQQIASFFTNLYPSAYRVDEYQLRYFTPPHYELVTTCTPVFCVILIVLIFVLIWRRTPVLNRINGLMHDLSWLIRMIVTAFSGLSIPQKWAVGACFCFLAAVKVYLFFDLPYQIDEAFNFVYFTNQGVWHTTIFANSHTLSNLISCLMWKAGFSPELSTRFPSFLAAILVHVVLYSAVKHFFNFRIAIFVLLLTGVSFWSNVYAVESGAYIVVTVWVLIGAVAIFGLYDEHSEGSNLFVASCILGFYTSKLFVIPFISLVILWVGIAIYRRTVIEHMGEIAGSIALVFIGSVSLYFPMYLWSGVEAIVASNIPRHDLFKMSPVLMEGFSVMTETSNQSYVVVMIMLMLGVVFIKSANKKLKAVTGFAVATSASILLFSITFHVYPPSRSLIYTNTMFYACLGIIIGTVLFGRFDRSLVAIVCGVLVCLKMALSFYIMNFGWQNYYLGLRDVKSYERLNDTVDRVLRCQPNLIFSDARETYLDVYIRLAAVRDGSNVTITYSRTSMFSPDVIVLTSSDLSSESFYPMLENVEFGRIFVKPCGEKVR